MTLPSDPATRPSKWPLRFSLRSLFWLAVVIALALTCIIQTRRLRDAQAALARNAWAMENAAIPPGKFRLLVNKVIDSTDIKVTVIRFEANEEHFITAGGSGSVTSPAEGDGAHWAEIRLVASYDSMAKHLTTLIQATSNAGTAGGRSIYPLRDEPAPGGGMIITIEPGIYDLKQPVELCRTHEGAVMLTVK